LPLIIAQGETTPMPPLWLAVAVQLQCPLESLEQVAVDQPRGVMEPPPLSHAMGTDETDKQAGDNGNVMEPVVTVLSV
jgi:hypothetical protein